MAKRKTHIEMRDAIERFLDDYHAFVLDSDVRLRTAGLALVRAAMLSDGFDPDKEGERWTYKSKAAERWTKRRL